MSKFYCTNCEQFIEEEDLNTRRECVGEFWGAPAYETFSVCPYCGSDEILSEDDDDFPTEEEDEEDGD